MYNSRIVLAGIIVFVVLFSSPFWAGYFGQSYKSTGIVAPEEKSCIEDVDFMRAQHMRLLNEWRDEALRKENRVYVSAKDGKKWAISLQNTCMKCHTNYKDFCAKCHVANSVYPYCWTCHIIPTEGK